MSWRPVFHRRMEERAAAAENRIREEQRASSRYLALKEKFARLYDHDPYGIHAKVIAFSERLVHRYPNARQVQLFHVLTGSTPLELYGPFDFPAPDSIEEFIDAELKAMLTKESGP